MSLPAVDLKRGAVPRIEPEKDGCIYRMEVRLRCGLPGRLTIRHCDANDEQGIAISGAAVRWLRQQENR